MKEIQFKPKDVTVAKGGTVTWTNNESVPHDVTKEDGPGPDFSSGKGNMQKGDTLRPEVRRGRQDQLRVHGPPEHDGHGHGPVAPGSAEARSRAAAGGRPRRGRPFAAAGPAGPRRRRGRRSRARGARARRSAPRSAGRGARPGGRWPAARPMSPLCVPVSLPGNAGVSAALERRRRALDPHVREGRAQPLRRARRSRPAPTSGTCSQRVLVAHAGGAAARRSGRRRPRRRPSGRPARPSRRAPGAGRSRELGHALHGARRLAVEPPRDPARRARLVAGLHRLAHGRGHRRRVLARARWRWPAARRRSRPPSPARRRRRCRCRRRGSPARARPPRSGAGCRGCGCPAAADRRAQRHHRGAARVLQPRASTGSSLV